MSTGERTALFLRHIVDATDRIHDYVNGLDEAAFLANQFVQDAMVRNLEVIGEACSSVRRHDPAFASAHSEVPWSDAIGNRNVLSHGYFSIDYALVWNTVKDDLPTLRHTVALLLT